MPCFPNDMGLCPPFRQSHQHDRGIHDERRHQRSYDALEVTFGRSRSRSTWVWKGGPKNSKASYPFIDEEDYKRRGRVGLNADHPLIIPAPAPPFPLNTTPRRKRLGINPQGDAELHTTHSDSHTNGNIDVQLVTEQAILSIEHHSQPVVERSLPTPVSNGPIKRV